jgi:hypothetical protein
MALYYNLWVERYILYSELDLWVRFDGRLLGKFRTRAILGLFRSGEVRRHFASFKKINRLY